MPAETSSLLVEREGPTLTWHTQLQHPIPYSKSNTDRPLEHPNTISRWQKSSLCQCHRKYSNQLPKITQKNNGLTSQPPQPLRASAHLKSFDVEHLGFAPTPTHSRRRVSIQPEICVDCGCAPSSPQAVPYSSSYTQKGPLHEMHRVRAAEMLSAAPWSREILVGENCLF